MVIIEGVAINVNDNMGSSGVIGTDGFKVTVTLAVCSPPDPKTVILNVFVDVGDTVFDPLTVDAPKFESVTDLAFEEVHSSRVLSPSLIAVGVAVNLIVGTVNTEGITVTVILAVESPPGPATIIIYVVVSDGEKDFDPLIVAASKLELLTLVPFVDDHSKIVFAPEVIDDGVAFIVTVGTGFAPLPLSLPPPHPAIKRHNTTARSRIILR